MAQDLSIKKGYLLRVDSTLWDKFLETIPRSKYTSINEALNEMIQERVDFTFGANHGPNDTI